MTSKLLYVPKLVGPNYIPWKKKLIDIIMSKNLSWLVTSEHKKPIDSKYLVIWEEGCDQARGLIGQTISDSLQLHVEVEGIQLHIEVEDSPIEVWKTLSSLFDKSDDVSV
jgi:hypothetical protein